MFFLKIYANLVSILHSGLGSDLSCLTSYQGFLAFSWEDFLFLQYAHTCYVFFASFLDLYSVGSLLENSLQTYGGRLWFYD